MAKLNLVGGEVGGVGKSFFCRILVEYHLKSKMPFYLIDADRTTPNVSIAYKEYLHPSADGFYFTEDIDLGSRADILLQLLLEKDVILNLPSQSTSILSTWIKNTGLLGDMGKLANIQVLTWFVARAQQSSLDVLKGDFDFHEGKMPYILVKNNISGTGAKWPEILKDNSPNNDFLKKHGIDSIEIPYLQVSTEERAKFAETDLKYSDLCHVDEKNLKDVGKGVLGMGAAFRLGNLIDTASKQIADRIGKDTTTTTPTTKTQKS